MTPEYDRPKIELLRDGKDRLIPKDFFEILTRRFFPVLSLTYISSILGIAAKKGSILHFAFEDSTAYTMSLLVVLWVSIPAIIWIILHGSPLYKDVADIWYKIIAALMIVMLLMGYILFPEINPYGLRLYFVASMPALLIMYIFFVKGGLPAMAAHPLTAIGLSFLIYGAVINLIY